MRKLAYKRWGLSDFTILFYFKEMCLLLSAVLNGTLLRASESLTFYTSQFRANTENSHGIEKMMSQYCAQNEFDEITVQRRRGRGGRRGR